MLLLLRNFNLAAKGVPSTFSIPPFFSMISSILAYLLFFVAGPFLDPSAFAVLVLLCVFATQ